jgi:hypothetical protein
MGNIAVKTQNFMQNLFGSTSPAATTAAVAAAPTPAYSADQVQLSSTPADPNTQTAGFFKKVGDSFGEMFGDMAYSMKMGETYRMVDNEFRKVDGNMDGQLNQWEFTMATMNPFDFQYADRNMDGRVNQSEYAKFRKDRLEMAFVQRDVNGDRHLNVAEIGSIGRVFLANRDPRLDANQDGLVNKREFVRAQLTLGVSIRDILGF